MDQKRFICQVLYSKFVHHKCCTNSKRSVIHHLISLFFSRQSLDVISVGVIVYEMFVPIGNPPSSIQTFDRASSLLLPFVPMVHFVHPTSSTPLVGSSASTIIFLGHGNLIVQFCQINKNGTTTSASNVILTHAHRPFLL